MIPDKIHYGCADRFLPGWINVDKVRKWRVDPKHNYTRVDLAGRHPWADHTFRFGFAEHLTQCEALTFLFEAYTKHIRKVKD